MGFLECREDDRLNEVQGFVKAEGTKLINGAGCEILLRGVGLGSWLLPEGYMWRFPDQGDRPRHIERMIEELVGREKAEKFWEIYFDRYIAEGDIRQIASEGFNSIRIPMNARWIIGEETPVKYNAAMLKRIDRVLEWCRKYGVYAILDLHGAPGGQTGTNIDDSEHDRPELFTEERNKRLTVELWRMLAERYRDEWIVAGYDLLNEPLPDWFSCYNQEVMPLYEEITKAIREVDTKHMIILEGAHWSTDWSIFNKKIDDNLMLQFHKYWNNPDTGSIQVYLDKRKEWEVPIFMGEGGENNKDWYTGAFQLFEDHGISWNFWTWKKMDTTNSPCSIKMPNKWYMLVDFLQGGEKPDKASVEQILREYLDNLEFQQCTYHAEVVKAIFRRAPVRIPAIFYGFKGEGESFGLTKHTKTGIEFRVFDETDIRFVKGSATRPNFRHGKGEEWKEEEWLCLKLLPGDWAVYEIETDNTGSANSCHIALCLMGETGIGKLSVFADGRLVGKVDAAEKSWAVVELLECLQLGVGKHYIRLAAEGNAVSIKWLKIYY